MRPQSNAIRWEPVRAKGQPDQSGSMSVGIIGKRGKVQTHTVYPGNMGPCELYEDAERNVWLRLQGCYVTAGWKLLEPAPAKVTWAVPSAEEQQARVDEEVEHVDLGEIE